MQTLEAKNTYLSLKNSKFWIFSADFQSITPQKAACINMSEDL